MNAKDAREIGRQWVVEEASTIPGFYGAYFGGSTNWMPDEALLPPSSDVDILVILEGSEVPGEVRKFHYRDVLFEVSYGPSSEFQSPEQILGNYYRAGHFSRPCIIA